MSDWKPDICIHHAPCADGFTAAWAIWKRWPDIEFVPGVYGQDPPDVSGKNVLIVDFSYKRPVLEEMAKTARTITILDHHKSAEADLSDFASVKDGKPWVRSPDALHRYIADAIKFDHMPDHLRIQALFDMTKSGAMLAWEYAHPGDPVPAIVALVQDRDLWKFDFYGTRAVAAVIFSYPYDFGTWDQLAITLSTRVGLEQTIAEGQAIERKHHKDIAELLNLTTRSMTIAGYPVLVANLPYTMSSDAANQLAQGMPFGACYYDNAEGQRVFSLRSTADGVDVSEKAVRFGGGGHARAAGFTASKGWEGD